MYAYRRQIVADRIWQIAIAMIDILSQYRRVRARPIFILYNGGKSESIFYLLIGGWLINFIVTS